MVSRRRVSVVAALAAALLLGVLITTTAPSGVVAAAEWPVGAATGCSLWVRRRAGLGVLLVAGAGVFLSYLLSDLSIPDALALATFQLVAMVVVVLVLTDRGRRRATLLTEQDITRYTVASALGGLVVGVLVAGWGVLTGLTLGWSAVGVGTQHLASELVLLPFFMRMHTHRSSAPVAERILQWILTLTICVAVFGASATTPTVFLVLTCLAWGARRLGTWEALVQMVLVAAIATSLTRRGHGPFALSHDSTSSSLDLQAFMLATFLVCASFVVVPLVLTVGRQLQSLTESAVHADRLERIVRSAAGTVIIAADAAGRMTLFNPAAERALGYDAADMLGRYPRMFHPDDQITALAEEFGVPDDFGAVAQVMCRPENAAREIRFIRSDGVERIHLMTLSTVHDDKGVATGFVNISEDVTDRVREQEALQLALDQRRTLDEAKDVFVSSVSHELRTPLASIVGYVELLQDGAYGVLDEQQSNAVARIAGNSDRLLVLIDDLLLFSRLKDDTMQVDHVEVDLGTAVDTACEMLEPTWVGRDLVVAVSVPDPRVVVLGDRGLLERLVVNLVGNAVKFTPDGGRIDVGLTVDGEWAVVEVVDTGVGISADDLSQLFTRFFRSRHARHLAVPGTGLGLSIVRTIAEAHGGSIDVASTEGVGTTMVARLPLLSVRPRPPAVQLPGGNVQDSTTVVRVRRRPARA